MGFKTNFSSSANAFETKFNNEAQEHSPNFGTYNTIYEGENGATFYPNVSEDGILSWTNDRKLPNPTPRKVRGEDGTDGEDGVSVTSVRQTTTSNADGGTNVITVTLSNGKDYTFTVINGSKGSKGDTGDKGEKGDKGDTGATGAEGQSIYVEQMIEEEDGIFFEIGNPNLMNHVSFFIKHGRTPKNGVDYFTPADKQDMINSVIAALPVYGGEVESV